jgi:hypothetical protein
MLTDILCKIGIGEKITRKEFTGFPRVLENLENYKFVFQAWKCPGILQSLEMSWKKYCLRKKST